MTEITTNGNYLKKIAESYDKSKSMTEILSTFRCMSEEYQKVNEIDDTFIYSDYNYKKCSQEEQKMFFNDQLIVLETLICNSIYDKVGIVHNWKDVYDLIVDPNYKNTPKINRKVVFATSTSDRPIGDNAYKIWNGLQVIDLDIKDEHIATELEKHIADDLCKYHWFLGVVKSASGKGLHVWTKIKPISITFEQRKIEFACNFRHKYSYLYIILAKYAKELGYTDDDITSKYLDLAVNKPQQGLFIGSDENVFMNMNFKDLRLDTNFESAFDNGIESINWIYHPRLKEIFAKLEWFSADSFNPQQNISMSDIVVGERDSAEHPKRHYKHYQRWQLANTLTRVYGYEQALRYMIEICAGTDVKELRGDVKTASVHNKPISMWALEELIKNHGFDIKVNGDIYKEKQEELVGPSMEDTPTQMLDSAANDQKLFIDTSEIVNLSLKADEYLSTIKDDIIKNLSHITLLEAGAGYGKTEMIKALNARTLLILPFTSTIKSKIEASLTTANWLCFYGNKRPSIDDILGHKSMAMTIDKFSRLNVMELDTANFEYIVLDESHLLFTSSYRDVMSPTIQRLANCKAKIIMMTGTPTGELTFFPNIKHIKVTKEDKREKVFDVRFYPTATEQYYEMCKSMADDIMHGKRVFHPSNKGTAYFEQLFGVVQKMLDDMHFGRQINTFYYKKANFGDESMNNIDINKSVGNNDIICCTTYLSVGVDIEDKYVFSIYFNEPEISQDIEQYANRIRNNNLYVKLFLPKKDSDGVPIDYYNIKRFDLSFDPSEILVTRDYLKTCNDMISRNEEESKFNPIISHLIGKNPYLKYDENECRYYIDETMYKLQVFEQRFKDYGRQLKVIVGGMRYFGYTITTFNSDDEVAPQTKEWLETFFQECRTRRYNYITESTREFLSQITEDNIDDYREVVKGNYDLIRGTDENNVKTRLEHKMYTKDIEILEKNIPIILSLYKYYDIPDIRSIYEFCIDKRSNRINFTKLDRIKRFANIVSSIKKKRLDFPVYKFIQDARKWAVENPEVEKKDIDWFLKSYAAKYANTIPDVVVEDVKFLETIYNLITELWKVVVTQSMPKKGKIQISPFELLWTTKESVDDVYGNAATKAFFVQQLIDDLHPDSAEFTIPTDEALPDLEHTHKFKLDDVKAEIPEVVHSQFNYYEYSELDKSNDRFMAKQKRTNLLRDDVFDNIEVETDDETPGVDITLF